MKVAKTFFNTPLPICIGLVLTMALGPAANAQSRQEDPEKYYRAPNTLHGKTVLIPIGSHIEGRMNKTISSKTSKQGEKFTIEITSPVLANGSDVIIPIGSKIIGEVVEAIPASKQKHPRGTPKPSGKLRTSLSLLQTPDGMSRPLIASIAGEFLSTGSGRLQPNQELANPSLGYAGSGASFAAVHPSMNKRNYGNQGPKVVSKRDYWQDPVLGVDRFGHTQRGTPVIRSMVKKGRDIYIMSGSPLAIRVDAPLKISVAPSKGRMSIDIGTTTPPAVQSSGRRFQPAGGTQAPPEAAENSESQENKKAFTHEKMLKEPVDPEAHLPRFLRTPKNLQFLKPSPFSAGDPAQGGQQGNSGQQVPQGQPAQAEPAPVNFSPGGQPSKKGADDF